MMCQTDTSDQGTADSQNGTAGQAGKQVLLRKPSKNILSDELEAHSHDIVHTMAIKQLDDNRENGRNDAVAIKQEPCQTYEAISNGKEGAIMAMDDGVIEPAVVPVEAYPWQALTPDDSCDLNPEFAVICSFIAHFGDKIDLELNIEQLKAGIENQTQLDPNLLELHVKLLKKVRRYFVRDQWEKVLIRFTAEYSYEDAFELEQLGYLKTRTSIKLKLLSRLMDAQFNSDQKFKNAVNLIEADDLRISPLGRDIKGNTYWQRVDKDGNLRIFQEEPLNYKSWKTICSNNGQLNELINRLEECKDEKVKGEPMMEPYNPYPEIFSEYFEVKKESEKPGLKRELEDLEDSGPRTNQKTQKGRKGKFKKFDALPALAESKEEEKEVTKSHLDSKCEVKIDSQVIPKTSSSEDCSVESQVTKTIESLLSRVMSSISYVFRPLSRNSNKSPEESEKTAEPLRGEQNKATPKLHKKRAAKKEKIQEVVPRRTSSRIQQLQQKKIAEQEEELKKMIESNAGKKSSSITSSIDEDSRNRSINSRNINTTDKKRSESPESKGRRKRRKKGQSWRRGKGKKKLSWDKDDSDLSSTSSLTESEKSDFEDVDETLAFDDNNYDDEFACEEEDTINEPVIIKRARTARQSVGTTGEQAGNLTMNTTTEEDKPCGRCDKSNDPDWILLCDMCDDGYHTSCCIPPLMIIPDGDWYCPICEHKMLMNKLKSLYDATKEILDAKEREMMKMQRLRQKTSKPRKIEASVQRKPPSDELLELTDDLPRPAIQSRERLPRPEPRSRKTHRKEYSDEEEEEGDEDIINDDDDDYVSEYRDDETEEEVEEEEEEEKLPEKRRRKVINRLNEPLELSDLESTDAESIGKPDSDVSFQASATEEEEEEEEEDLTETEVSDDSTSIDELIASHIKKKKKVKRYEIESRTRRATSMRVSYKESTDEEDEATNDVPEKSPDDFKLDDDEEDDRSTSISEHSYQQERVDDEPEEDEEVEDEIAATVTNKKVSEPIIMRFNASYVDLHQPAPTTDDPEDIHPPFYED